TFTLDPTTDFAFSESCTVTVLAPEVTDQDTLDPPNNMSANFAFSFPTEAPPPPPTFIHGIQCAAHTSPRTGQSLGNAPGIGIGGRMPPTSVIEDDASSGNVETSGVFDPASDGLDLYESLEAMLVQINDPVIVGPTNSFNEIPVLPDDGSWAGPRTAHGGIL